MKSKLPNLAGLYRSALRAHLRQGRHASLEPAREFGRAALKGGVQTLDLAKLHEQTMVAELLPRRRSAGRGALLRQAGIFFAAAITPLEKTYRSAREATAHLQTFIEALSRRTVELAASNRELKLEIAQRKVAEKALKKSETHYCLLLERSDHLQEQLRRLSRQILSAQEEDRRKISRELHDVIAQTLTGINLRLAALKQEAAVNTKGIESKITRTQRLVEKSVRIVHRFARELRPAVLDDLGLIPALHSFMNAFTTRTGVRTRLVAFAEVEALGSTQRTALFRIAQEALTNVGRHANASRAEVNIQNLSDGVQMRISDDGRSFQLQRVLESKRGKHLGLLGMRERLEMMGGRLQIKATPGKGTAITAHLPAAPPATPAPPPPPAGGARGSGRLNRLHRLKPNLNGYEKN